MMSRRFPQFLHPGRALMVIAVGIASLAFMPTQAHAQATQPAGLSIADAKPGQSLTDSLAIPTTEAAPRGDANNPADVATQGHSIGFDLSRLAIALIIVIALIFAARWFVARMFAGTRAPSASRAIKVLGRSPLAPRQQVLLLQVGKRVIVVGESNGQLSTLANLDDPDEVAGLIGQLQEEQIARASSFGGLFQRAEKKFEEEPVPMQSAPATGSTPMTTGLTEEAEVRSELSGLAEKLRMIRSQMNRSPDA